MTTKQRQHRKERRLRRMCVAEGCPVETGDVYRCDEHAQVHAAACKAAYWAKRERAARRAA